MLAIDTNVIVRVVTADHPLQSKAARAFVDTNDVTVSLTVLLETGWVLRSAYGVGGGELIDTLELFLGLPKVQVEAPERVAAAFAWARRGMDFADALHLASAQGADGFATFDATLRATAKRLGVTGVTSPA